MHVVMQQIDELLNEVKPSTKKTAAVTHFVEKLQSLLFRMKKGKRERQVICDLFWTCDRVTMLVQC